MKLDESVKELLRVQTVRMVLAVRREYLANGGSPLKQWDQITDRMRAAARTCASPEEWATAVLRTLQIASPNKETSSALRELAEVVRKQNCAREWLDLVEREHGYVIALARLEAEKRKSERQQLAAEAAALEET